jgi:hypothetical protein
MQISAYFHFDDRALEFALKQLSDNLMPATNLDRVRGLELMHPLPKVPLRRRRDQIIMILDHYIAMLSHPVALCPLRSDRPENSTDLNHHEKSLPVWIGT